MGSWTARNSGLSGTALNANWIIQNPSTKHLSNTSHDLWLATGDGLFHSLDGGLGWAKITLPDPSNAEFSDSPAATIDELSFFWIAFDPSNSDTIVALAAKDSVSRLWLYRSDDIAISWISRGVTT